MWFRLGPCQLNMRSSMCQLIPPPALHLEVVYVLESQDVALLVLVRMFGACY